MDKPRYINWIVHEEGTTFEDGVSLECYRLDYKLDPDILNEWAKHIRRHYISDGDLTEATNVLSLSSKDYLNTYVIPQPDEGFGNTACSNDITEILVSDLFEFILNYTVPRCKQYNRSGKNQSEHGTDVIGYRFKKGSDSPSKDDELIAIEVKAQLSTTSFHPIKAAITDSQKYDEHRYALTLDYYRKKLKSIGNVQQANEITRFQLKPEKPYRTIFVGAGVSSIETIKDNIIVGITGDSLSLQHNNRVFFIHGKKLMDLAHEVFRRCVE